MLNKTKVTSKIRISKYFSDTHGTNYARAAEYVCPAGDPSAVELLRAAVGDAPAPHTLLGSRVGGHHPAAPGGGDAALFAGRVPAPHTCAPTLRPARRPGRQTGVPRLRHPPHALQPGRTAPQRQQRLLGADSLAATRHPHHPHGILHLPRRPHRPHDSRNPHPQIARRSGSAGHLRCGGLMAAEPQDAAPDARSGRADARSGHPHGRLRPAAVPVVPAGHHATQPSQNSSHGRQGSLHRRHQHSQILLGRRRQRQMARRTLAGRGRHRGRPATALPCGLGRGAGRTARPGGLHHPAHRPGTHLPPTGVVRRRA